ncbi:MAG: hypothetical protein QXL67_05405, partial [Candidatus Bathyarchaeia archaeon]
MFRKIWFGLILMAILLSVSAVLSTETGVNFDETLVTAQQEVPVEISVDIYGVCRNETVIIGKRGWSDETFVLTLLSPMVVDVHLYDSFLVGDYYELWDNSTGTPVLVGATPVVPGYWEGGTEYSEGWFTLSLSAGV